MERYPGLPPLPDRIRRLEELACDLWWSWHYRARDVFKRLDYPLWRDTAHNPVRMLRVITPDRLQWAAGDRSFLALYDSVVHDLDRARPRATPGGRSGTERRPRDRRSPSSRPSSPCTSRCRSTRAASACWPAITARKRATSACRSSASGSCIPQGYFHQNVSADGWQLESYERLDWLDAPIEPAMRADGPPCVVAVPLGDRTVLAAVWRRPGGPGAALSCSTPISTRTRRGTASCRRGCTAATRRRASSRRSCWGSAACARCTRSASNRLFGT